jgi:TetR/AcrR family transcriptional repressor of nem operon
MRSETVRVSSEEKARSRERIIAAAGRLFRSRGIEGTSVADVMREAGLTHGGFYRHFPDKNALVAAALEAGFSSFAGPLLDGTGEPEMFRTRYLSPEHRDNPGLGCPVAALAAEVARSDASLRGAMSAGVESVLRGLANGDSAAREAALRQLAQLVGAIVIARAVDEPLSSEVLSAIRAG